ncbi:MAG: hypothetical protein OdinLCB4_004525 [Candidatus Odinarchaeum yellowstonii]|uniref:Uncharacterized protein n=1 Tax=Odinarchaeota yellowstonii (strain LCB_4) TaxID=1841599 RepID=A0AAF0D164_ODILC|nr:MAG: hypothetical protein OdinLCB4_004525 [Candidatus Odinarchaeum yellowstonii]
MIIKRLEEPFAQYVIGITAFNTFNLDDSTLLLAHITHSTKLSEQPVIQFFNADKIAGWLHLYTSAYFTVKSLVKLSTKIKSIELELLRWVSAQKQLSDAINIMGVKEGDKRLAVLSIGLNENTVRDKISQILGEYNLIEQPELLEIDENKIQRLKRLFQISDTEFNSLLEDRDNPDSGKTLIIKLIINRISALILKK